MAISFVAEDVKDLQPLFRLLYLVFKDFFFSLSRRYKRMAYFPRCKAICFLPNPPKSKNA